MKVLILIGLLILSSCSLMKEVRNEVLGFNYSEISPGSEKSFALTQRGLTPYVFESNEKSIYLYKDGYLLFNKNDRLIESSQYKLFLGTNDLLSHQVLNNSDIFDVLKTLGQPISISEQNSNFIFKFRRGAVLSSSEIVLAAVDKVYSDIEFNLGINAYTDNTASLSDSYLLLPGSRDVSPEDFQFKEIKSQVATSLKAQGYKITDEQKNAKYILFINYGISEPNEDIQVISRPIYIPSYIAGNTTNFYGSTGSYLGSASSEGRWTSQYAGQHTQTIKTISYSRWINLEAVDYKILRNTKSIKPVWKVLVNSIGSSGDLRFVLPALSYGAMSYIDQDTKRELHFKVNANSLNEFVYSVRLENLKKRDIASKK